MTLKLGEKTKALPEGLCVELTLGKYPEVAFVTLTRGTPEPLAVKPPTLTLRVQFKRASDA